MLPLWHPHPTNGTYRLVRDAIGVGSVPPYVFRGLVVAAVKVSSLSSMLLNHQFLEPEHHVHHHGKHYQHPHPNYEQVVVVCGVIEDSHDRWVPYQIRSSVWQCKVEDFCQEVFHHQFQCLTVATPPLGSASQRDLTLEITVWGSFFVECNTLGWRQQSNFSSVMTDMLQFVSLFHIYSLPVSTTILIVNHTGYLP